MYIIGGGEGRGGGYNKPPQSSNRFMDNNENIGALSTFAINVVQKNALNVVAIKNGRVDLPITEHSRKIFLSSSPF